MRASSETTQIAGGDPLIGAVLHGYRLIEAIGTGAAAVVYRARHEVLEREAAVKVLCRPALGNGNLIERFRREAHALSRIQHPHVVEVIDFGATPDRRPFLTMELLKGRTLSSLLLEEDRLPVGRIIQIARDVAAGLAEAHRHGLVHRDLKPSNVMLVGPDQSAKILDFGMVRVPSDADLTDNDVVLGTPRYMAPEQVMSPARAEPRSDLYALGVMIYEMLSGRVPFDGPILTVLKAQLHHSPAPLHTTTGLEPLVFALLQKEPKDRPPSAEALLDALELIESLETTHTEWAPLPRFSDSGTFDERTELANAVVLHDRTELDEPSATERPPSVDGDLEDSGVTHLSALLERDGAETELETALDPELMNQPLHPPSDRGAKPGLTRLICEEDLASQPVALRGTPADQADTVPPTPRRALRSPSPPAAPRPKLAPWPLPQPRPQPRPQIVVETSSARTRRAAGALGLIGLILIGWLASEIHAKLGTPVVLDPEPRAVPMVSAQ